MSFLAAGWLWVLPLAAAPVVFHLIMRRRRHALVLPTLMFLHMVDPRHRARRRLRELAVLALRCLAVALAVLALARPTIAGIGGGPAAVVVLIDNSASTTQPAAADPQRSVLDLAAAGAGALLAALAPGDAAAVLPAVPDPALPEPTTLDRNHDAVRHALDGLRSTDAAVHPAAALRRAAALLGGSGATRRELHVFTDGQAADWAVPAPGAAVPAPGAALPAGTTVIVHRISPRPASAAAVIANLRAISRLPAGRPLVIHVALANPGREAATVTVQAVDNAGRAVAVPASVPAGGSADAALVLPGSDAGMRTVGVRLDGAPGAGTTGCIITAAEAPRTVVALGGRTALGALVPALDPTGDGSLSGLHAAAATASTLAPALATGEPVLAVATWDAPPEALARLRSWCEGGGALVLVPPKDGSSGPPGWSGADPAGIIVDERGLAIIASDPGDPLLRDLVSPNGTVDLGGARLRRGLALRPLAGAHAVLSAADGRVVLVSALLGKGRVATCGFAWFPAATDLPARAAAIALAQGLALPAEPAPPAQALVAGEPPRLPIPPDTVVRLIAPNGALCWNGRASDLPPPPRTGAWSVLPPSGPPILLAVRADPNEGDPRLCPAGTLPALAALAPEMRTLADPADAAAAWRSARGGADMTPWLVLLAALALVAESWLANPTATARPASTGSLKPAPSP